MSREYLSSAVCDRAARLQRLAIVLKFGFRKYKYYTISAANNKDADQTAQMRRMICAFAVRIWQTSFVMTWPEILP